MGHAQYQTTLAVYTHCGAEDAIVAMQSAMSNADVATEERRLETTPMLTPIAR